MLGMVKFPKEVQELKAFFAINLKIQVGNHIGLRVSHCYGLESLEM